MAKKEKKELCWRSLNTWAFDINADDDAECIEYMFEYLNRLKIEHRLRKYPLDERLVDIEVYDCDDEMIAILRNIMDNFYVWYEWQ